MAPWVGIELAGKSLNVGVTSLLTADTMMISVRVVVSQNPTVVGGSVIGVDQ